jgi:membrane protein
MVVAVGLITVSEIVLYRIGEFDFLNDAFIIFMLDIARWLIIILLIYSSITILYNAGDLNRKKWKLLNAGSWFATIFFILASLGFAWFVQNFASYNKLYGSLGTLLVLLIWMNFNCVILLLGFELNASISKAKRSVEEIKD